TTRGTAALAPAPTRQARERRTDGFSHPAVHSCNWRDLPRRRTALLGGRRVHLSRAPFTYHWPPSTYPRSSYAYPGGARRHDSVDRREILSAFCGHSRPRDPIITGAARLSRRR